METSCHIQNLTPVFYWKFCMWLYNVQVLFLLEDITTKSATDNFLDLISDRILSEVSSGSSLWTSCHNIDNDMGFHFGLDALEFYYDTIPHGLSWFLFETLVLDRWSVVCYPPPPEVKLAPIQILKVKKLSIFTTSSLKAFTEHPLTKKVMMAYLCFCEFGDFINTSIPPNSVRTPHLGNVAARHSAPAARESEMPELSVAPKATNQANFGPEEQHHSYSSIICLYSNYKLLFS